MSEENQGAVVEAPEADSAAATADDAPLGEAGERALKAERDARKQLERELRELRKQLSPEAARAAEERARAAEEARLRSQEEAETKVKRVQSKYEKDLQAKVAELDAERQQFRQFRLQMDGQRIFQAAEGLDGVSQDGRTFFDLFWAVHRERFNYDDQGQLMVVDAQGDPVMDEESGKRVSATDYVKRLQADPVYGYLFKPAYGSGSGGRSTRDGRVIPGKKLSIKETPKAELFREAFGAR